MFFLRSLTRRRQASKAESKGCFRNHTRIHDKHPETHPEIRQASGIRYIIYIIYIYILYIYIYIYISSCFPALAIHEFWKLPPALSSHSYSAHTEQHNQSHRTTQTTRNTHPLILRKKRKTKQLRENGTNETRDTKQWHRQPEKETNALLNTTKARTQTHF